MSDKVLMLLADVKALSVLELSELVKPLEEAPGGSAAASPFWRRGSTGPTLQRSWPHCAGGR